MQELITFACKYACTGPWLSLDRALGFGHKEETNEKSIEVGGSNPSGSASIKPYKEF